MSPKDGAYNKEDNFQNKKAHLLKWCLVDCQFQDKKVQLVNLCHLCFQDNHLETHLLNLSHSISGQESLSFQSYVTFNFKTKNAHLFHLYHLFFQDKSSAFKIVPCPFSGQESSTYKVVSPLFSGQERSTLQFVSPSFSGQESSTFKTVSPSFSGQAHLLKVCHFQFQDKTSHLFNLSLSFSRQIMPNSSICAIFITEQTAHLYFQDDKKAQLSISVNFIFRRKKLSSSICVTFFFNYSICAIIFLGQKTHTQFLPSSFLGKG